MMKSKNHNIYYILFLIFLLLIFGCKKPNTPMQNITISVLEYNRLATIESKYKNLSQDYTKLQTQYNLSITQRDKQIKNISDILHNQLRYEKPLKLYNPLKLFNVQLWDYSFDYPTSAKIANTSIFGAFIIDFILALGFFFADRYKKTIFAISIISVTLLIGILLLMLNQII